MEKKIKVVHILDGLVSAGGVQTFVYNVIDHIDRSRFEISVLLPTTAGQPLEEEITRKGVAVYHIREFTGVVSKLLFFFRVIRFFRKNGPFDAMHTHNSHFNGVYSLAAFFAGVPVRIVHSHSPGSENKGSGLLYKSMRAGYHQAMKLFMKTATHRLGCSEAANEYAYGRNWSKSGRCRVINNGINLQQFRVARDIGAGPIQFVTVGRICEVKNPFFIVEVMKELMEARRDIYFTWVGTGPLEEKVRKMVESLGLTDHFTLLGDRRDVAAVLSRMDYMLFPSKWEGLSMALVEAQAAGLPCFISDTMSREVDLGLCTVLSLKEDAKAWAEKILPCLDSPGFRKKVDESRLAAFDMRNIVRELQAMYRENNYA